MRTTTTILHAMVIVGLTVSAATGQAPKDKDKSKAAKAKAKVPVVEVAPKPPPPDNYQLVFESSETPVPASPLDKLVFAKFPALNIQPALCSDAVFVRRAYLDVLGILPTAQEARDFIRNPDKNKRNALIDKLLSREEFSNYWAMKWGDILRIKAEAPVNLWPNAAQAYHRWVRQAIAENKPFDQFARELLTSSGSNFRTPAVNFYRAIPNRTPEGIASAVALTFMGTRTNSWPQERLALFGAFFAQVGYKPTSEWKEEVVFWDPLKLSTMPGNIAPGKDALVPPPLPKGAPPVSAAAPESNLPKPSPNILAMYPDGKRIQFTNNQDPRRVFADWLITPKNPWFTRAIANRVWFWLMGRGIIHEPDDIREDNPPSNPELLAYLEKELIEHKYDMKHLMRLILQSQAYQLSSLPKSTAPEAEALFASYLPRRLEAEVLLDAINHITGNADFYVSSIPEPFTNMLRDKSPIVEDLREKSAVSLADGSIGNPFLTLFGRSARASGMETERSNKPSAAQRLQMLNSTWIQNKLERGPKLQSLLVAGRKPTDAAVEELYLTFLGRFPTPGEQYNAKQYSGPVVDLALALVNSIEFLYRH